MVFVGALARCIRANHPPRIARPTNRHPQAMRPRRQESKTHPCCPLLRRANAGTGTRPLPRAAGTFGELLARAALLHDAGKADERFRLYLHGGDELKWAADPTPLAKSGRLFAQNRAADRAARRKARWPKVRRR